MEPPPRSLALDAHYCIMVRVAWPTEYKYASAIGCACWRAPLGTTRTSALTEITPYKWLVDYDIPGVDGLALHHLYRAMAWLGEELPANQQDGPTPFAPRTIKDLIEEQLFARRRDLFSELSVV